MKEIIENFINAKVILNKTFNCNDNFFIKPLIDKHWFIRSNDNNYFLTYIDDNSQKDCFILKKNNKPMIYEKDNYTMIIGIECVKIAFVLDNTKNYS